MNVPSPAKLTYDGSKQTAISSNEIYTVKNGAATNAGSYKATLSLKDKDSYQWASTGNSDDIEVNWSISAASISSAKVSAAKQTFNGQALSPSVTVKLGDRTLKSGTDYAVSYSNKQHAGTAEATVTGKGNYAGTANGTFTISPANISEASISVAAQNYTGSQLTPVPTVTLDGKSLESGTDFTTSYSNNVKVGTANITVTGKGDYTGSATSTFKITRGQATVKKVKVGEITVTVYSYPDGCSYVDVPNQWLSISTCNNTNRCVDVAAVSMDNGANVNSWSSNGTNWQKWQFVRTENGLYKIIKVNSGKCLEVAGQDTNVNGGNVQQWDYVGGNNQKWKLWLTKDNKLVFLNLATQRALNITGDTATNGANVTIQDRNLSANQSWTLRRTSKQIDPNEECRSMENEIWTAYCNYRRSKGFSIPVRDSYMEALAHQSAQHCADVGKLEHTIREQYHIYSDILQYATYRMTGDDAVTKWKNHEGHRIMMNCRTVTEAGVGVVNKNGTYYMAIVYDFTGTNVGGD